MTVAKRLTLDANILMRAVLGVRVLRLLETYESSTVFYCADACIAEARHYVPEAAERRGTDAARALQLLERVLLMVETVELSLYGIYETIARERILRVM